MNIADQQSELIHIAQEVLDKLHKVAAGAEAWLHDPRQLSVDSLVPGAISIAAHQGIAQINSQNKNAYLRLSKEPLVSRVVAQDEKGVKHTRFFCRADQGMAQLGVISYLTKWGRLASIPVGDEYGTPDGQSWIVVSKTGLRPEKANGQWDAFSVVQREEFPPVTIDSLLTLVNSVLPSQSAQDILDQILAEEARNATIQEGIRRSVITKMGLRDQPILDKFQDEIFRLPLTTQIVLLGPPGTGKTTTLIRRLGQKIDTQFLDEDEQRVVNEVANDLGMPHERSWLMFTPTELLKQYLKEAFNREGVPASEQNLKTWDIHRLHLCREVFGILKTSTGGGTFIQKSNLDSLSEITVVKMIDWFSDFDEWQRQSYLMELTASIQILASARHKPTTELGEMLAAILAEHTNWSTTLISFSNELTKIQSFAVKQKEEIDLRLRAALVSQLQRNRNFVTEFAEFLATLQQSESDETEGTETEEDDDAQAAKVGLQAATNEYMQALRTLSRSAAAKRVVNINSRAGKIIEWLGDRILSHGDLEEIGNKLIVQAAARRFIAPAKQYIDGVAKRYRNFRRERQAEGVWYTPGGFDHRDIHPIELDAILLATLKAGNELMNRQAVLRSIDNTQWSAVRTMLRCYRHQIVIDEATDFSPIQLACMNELAHPRTRSVFACGDFNQRLTIWGVRSPKVLKWSMPSMEIREISVAYRQSKQLNDLARDIIVAVGGAAPKISLPVDVNNDVSSPVLLEKSSRAVLIKWLAQRITGIERFMNQLPSIAIFVNSESEVEPTAKELESMLSHHNIPVMACRDGQAVGQASSVRVFDIQHIKGLEFEAVFFLGIDRLAQEHPALFDKYIYVGATRAAAYLGLACETELPVQLGSIRHHFSSDWTHKSRG